MKGFNEWLQFRFKPNRDTAAAFILGLAVIFTSFGLLALPGDAGASRLGYFFLRDLVMMFGLGFAAPVYYVLFVKKRGFGELLLTRERWLASLAVNLALAVFLVFVFSGWSGPAALIALLSRPAAGPVAYIMTAGIFELVFFYGFMRQQFEEAFGLGPAIVLTALFYSLHHAGFEPRFVELFFVGIMYASVYRTTRNALVGYPFFWGVGACWDVLVDYGALERLQEPGIWLRTAVLLVMMASFLFWAGRRREKIFTADLPG
ncbi:MAG: CPBP family intramembrane metalloprotease [Syntrophomonadaceae bacterium]|nr:CPBP family intramembrane metalloprotease [Syntrophomonadaceae bacterium]